MSSVRGHFVTSAVTAAVCCTGFYIYLRWKGRKHAARRTVTHVLPDDASVTFKLKSPDPFGCSEVELPESFSDKYEIGEELGCGFSGVVYAVKTRIPQHLAVKMINKSKLEPDHKLLQLLEQEVALLKSLSHPYILSLFDVIETKTHILILTERAMGGDLYEELISSDDFPEEKARIITRQLVEATMYMHKKGIIHRDLKPENILLESSSGEPHIKICDFGLAKWFKTRPSTSSIAGSAPLPPPLLAPRLSRQPSTEYNNPFTRTSTIVGSELYQAPEVCGDQYSFQIDYYSIGVILHFMLCGGVPDKEEVVTCEGPEWETVSVDAKEVVIGLLQRDPRKRMTGIQVLHSAWLLQGGKPLPASPTQRPMLKHQSSSTMEAEAFSQLRLVATTPKLRPGQ